MNLKRILLVGAGLLALALAPASAQTVINQNLSGNEVIEYSLGLGGGLGNTTVNAIRNGTGYLLVPTGTTVNTIIPNTAAKVVVLGAITTWNITLPILPFDGQDVAIACPGGSGGTITVSATAPVGVTIVGTALTACASGGVSPAGGEFIYSTPAKTWYRIQ